MPPLVSGVDVTLSVEEGATPQATFGRGLCLSNVTTAITTQADLARHRTVRVYNNAADVKDGGETTAVQDAANVWFGGTIEPQAFLVATQFTVAQPIKIFGGSFTVTEAEGLGDSYSITIGARTITADFDGLTTAAAIATALQTGLNAHSDITGATVSVYDTDKLEIQLPASLTGSVVFDDTADELGLGPDDDVTYYGAIASAEEVDDALSRIVALNNDFTYVALPTDAYNDVSSLETADERIESLAAWAQANDRIFNFADYGDTVRTTDETTSNSALQLALTRRNVAGDYTGDAAGNLSFGIQSVMSAVRFDQVGTARNVANRRIPGVSAHTLTTAQAEELDRKRMNYYRKEGNLQHVRGGRTFGEWYEAAVWILWIQNEIALAAYNYMQGLEAFTASDDDYAGLREALSVPLRQGVDSGFLLPGTVSTAVRNHIRSTTGNTTFDGTLEDGFLVWSAAASTATASQLSNRESLPVYFWAKGAPMINEINISGNYAR